MEIVPYGDERKKHTIGMVEIANNLSTRSSETGNYDASVTVSHRTDWARGVVKGYKREEGAWKLVAKTISALKRRGILE